MQILYFIYYDKIHLHKEPSELEVKIKGLISLNLIESNFWLWHFSWINLEFSKQGYLKINKKKDKRLILKENKIK